MNELNRQIIDKLLFKKATLLENVPSIKRTCFIKVEQALDDKVSPILFGLRRTGKTTILLQLMQKYEDESIYITFRDSYINRLTREELTELIIDLYRFHNIRKLFLDEVQLMKEWSDWAVEIIDSFPNLRLVITGSSSLNLEKRETGLDRTRKINVQTLSFGEYLQLASRSNTENEFFNFIGFGGFPKYANMKLDNFDLLRSEIFDEIIENDIPLDNRSVESHLMSRLVYSIASLTNGEINVGSLAQKVSPNFLERDVLYYLSILEKSKVLKIVNRLNSDLTLPKKKKFKVYLNPHIHLWLLDSKFDSLPSSAKGHIIESYWLHWALTINDSSKTFYYLKDVRSGNEVDFVTLNASPVGPRIKTLHEFKMHSANASTLDFMKSFDSINKIVWSLDGKDIAGVQGKSILNTFDKEI